MINPSQFLYLTTVGWKSGKQHQIEIWFVEYNKRHYIISERRRHAHWVQNLIHNPKVSFAVNHDIFEGTSRIVDQERESELTAEVSRLMSTKYGWDEGLIVELTRY
ncbi:MAG: nitroreductase family deazaflavin-dependent oxidoreductase [Thermoproteota archaeon]|nr:nitroreductase family deazaflavin-dependent oxidoreductase [Thermoproteota archaeon]